MKRIISLVSVAMFLMFAASLLPAQDTMSKDSMSKGSKQTVTGCLQKGDEANGYMLTGDDGKVWELQAGKTNLADHVGHKVTVTGMSTKGSDAMEKKMADSESKETSGKEHGDLKVSSVKMVSDSCK